MRKVTNLWTMRDGGKIRICDMSDRHLINSMRMLERELKAATENAIDIGYVVMSGMQGEMAQYCMEADIRDLEMNGADMDKAFPIYEKLEAEANRRGLL